MTRPRRNPFASPVVQRGLRSLAARATRPARRNPGDLGAAHAAYDLAVRAMPTEAERRARAEQAAWEAGRAGGEATRRNLARRRGVKDFRAALRAVDRDRAPLELLRSADRAERAVGAGVLPENLDALRAALVAWAR